MRTAAAFFLLTSFCSANANQIIGSPGPTFHDAQNLDGLFSMQYDPTVLHSDIYPHVSIAASGSNSLHWYKFSATTLSKYVFDIDYGYQLNRPGDFGSGQSPTSVDLTIWLVDENGFSLQEVTSIYDSPTFQSLVPDAGSETAFDPLSEHIFTRTGEFYLLLCVENCNSRTASLSQYGSPIPTGSEYVLNVTLENAVTAVVSLPGTLLILLSGIGAFASFLRAGYNKRVYPTHKS